MITMYTARTAEVDVFETAIAEIKSKIDLTALKKYSGGIMYCSLEFMESGMVAALCKELPFDVIGMTCMGSADREGYGFFDLSLTVLTSDEVQFKGKIVTEMTDSNYEEKINELTGSIRADGGADSAMVITFIPFLPDTSGEKMMQTAEKGLPNVPIWGAMANSINHRDLASMAVMCNGVYDQNGMAMMSIIGPVKPKFILTVLPERNILNTRSIITKSEGAKLIEVNDMPLLAYYENMGIKLTIDNLRAAPLLIYHKDTAEPQALAIYTVYDDGSMLIGGDIPEGASVSVGGIDETTIIESCKQGLEEITAIKDRHAVLLLPCISRGMMMVPDQQEEMRVIHEVLTAEGVPFSMGYSNGEISPMMDANGQLTNRYHNYTFCACVLQ